MSRRPPADQHVRDEAARDLSHNIFLDAGAGTGKTDSLVRRYLAILAAPESDGGADVESVVAVTFTNKAAREMKERLRGECQKRAAELDGEEALLWRRRARALEGAPIGTIHSLCSALLRRFPVAARVDPQFSVLDDVTGRNLRSDTVRETLLQRLEDDEESAATLVAALGLSAALEAVEALIGGHREEAADRLERPPGAQALTDEWRAQAGKALAAASDLAEAQALLRGLAPSDPTDKLAPVRDRALECLALALDDNAPLDERMAALSDIADLKLQGGSAKKWPSKEALGEAKQAIKDARAIAKSLAGDWDPALEERSARATAALFAEAHAALRAYEKAKRAQSALDYDDLQLRARDLLRDHPDVRVYYQRRYRHILVDEFQDTNALQKDIIWRLAADDRDAADAEMPRPAPGKLFIVGDAKQSIYGFRGADVRVFNHTRDEFGEDRQRCRVLRLEVNFRTQPALSGFHNDLFSRPQVMGGDSPGRADYEALYEPLQAHRPALDLGPTVEFLAAVPPDAPEGEEEGPRPTAEQLREVEANLIADHIHGLIGRSVVAERDGDAERPCEARPGDFALLFRATGDMPLYERALRRRDIPFYTVRGRGFYQRQEVRDLLSLLRALENATDEVSLVGVLRSPMFGLSDRTLYWLTDVSPREPLFSLLRRAAREENEAHARAGQMDQAEREKVALASRVLSLLRELKNRLPLSALLSRALAETGFTSALAAQFGGEQMVANVRSLIQMAGGFERRGRYSLRDFVAYLEDLVVREERQGLAPLEEEKSRRSVKLMTIHAAKGLEWPIVIVPDLGRSSRGDRGRFRFHSDLGAAVRVEGDEGEQGWPTVGKLIAAQAEREEEAELRRLLYVACTRARDRLILSAGLSSRRAGLWLKWLTEEPQPLLDPKTDDAAQGETWRLQARRATAAEVEPSEGERRRRRSLAQDHRQRLMAGRELPGADAAVAERLRRQARPIPPASARRFSVTQLSAYLRCPREYELRYVRGLTEAPSARDLPSAEEALSAMERGLLVHRALEIVGRGGEEEVERAFEIALAGRSLPPRDVQQMREMVVWHLTQPVYAERVATADRLRSEMTVLFPLDDAKLPQQAPLLEGKIDALAEAGRDLHILDYKTGEEPQEEAFDDHRFQVGLYAFGVQRVLGVQPSSAAIAYLAAKRVRDLDLPADVDAAHESALRVVAGIARGEFGPRDDSPCAQCRLAWACAR